MRLLFVFMFLFISFGGINAQVPNTAKEHQKEYERRIKKEYLNDVYIPSDLTDAFQELRRLSDKNAIARFKSMEEDTVARILYFSLGRWITENWGFRGGSRLSHWLKTKIGISHPEDQATFIIRTFHRSLNKKELNVKELAKDLNEKRQKERVKNKKIIKTEIRQVPKDEKR